MEKALFVFQNGFKFELAISQIIDLDNMYLGSQHSSVSVGDVVSTVQLTGSIYWSDIFANCQHMEINPNTRDLFLASF